MTVSIKRQMLNQLTFTVSARAYTYCTFGCSLYCIMKKKVLFYNNISNAVFLLHYSLHCLHAYHFSFIACNTYIIINQIIYLVNNFDNYITPPLYNCSPLGTSRISIASIRFERPSVPAVSPFFAQSIQPKS